MKNLIIGQYTHIKNSKTFNSYSLSTRKANNAKIFILYCINIVILLLKNRIIKWFYKKNKYLEN